MSDPNREGQLEAEVEALRVENAALVGEVERLTRVSVVCTSRDVLLACAKRELLLEC